MLGKSISQLGSCLALTTALFACGGEDPAPSENNGGRSNAGGSAGTRSGAGGSVGRGGSGGGSVGSSGGSVGSGGEGRLGGRRIGRLRIGGYRRLGGVGRYWRRRRHRRIGRHGRQRRNSGRRNGRRGGSDNRPPCMKSPKQVISIGDSYMNWVSHTFPQDLNAAAGVTFRPTYAIGGYSMGSGGIGLIPTQFDTALAQDKDIIAVVLDGGGNDVLVPALGRPDCKNMANAGSVPGCQPIVTDALAAAETLMTKMVAAGVHDVIYFFYPARSGADALGGSHPNAMLDYALPRVKAFCDGVTAKTQGKGNCWFVDTVPLFEGHPEYFAAGDIHENSTGSKVIAKAVVDMMKSKCVAQPVSSGCCKP